MSVSPFEQSTDFEDPPSSHDFADKSHPSTEYQTVDDDGAEEVNDDIVYTPRYSPEELEQMRTGRLYSIN